MRLLTAILLTAFLFITPPAVAKQPLPIGKLIQQTEQSTVKILQPVDMGDDKPHQNVCTGFVVSAPKAWVLTAKHCVNEKDIESLTVDGNGAEIVKSDENFTLLKVAGLEMKKPPLDIRKDLPDVGEAVVAFGYGFGEMQVLQRHIASEFTDEGHTDIITDNALWSGQSGGPVVDQNGEVVGINQAANELLGVICSNASINKFLKTVK